MTLQLISNGDRPTGTEWMNNFNESLNHAILNHIRTLQDRSVTYSKGLFDLWGEAYIDADGRSNSVVTGSTTALFDTNKYSTKITDESGGDTTHNPSPTVSNGNNCFDGNITTYASYGTSGTGAKESYLGKTFSEKTVKYVYYSVRNSGNRTYNRNQYIYLETYNGSTWTNRLTIYSYTPPGNGGHDSGQLTAKYFLNLACQGIRLHIITNGYDGTPTHNHQYFELNYGEQDGEAIITHTIPTGTFSSTISNAIGTPLIADWETGADIQYKLTNATEDSGWLSYGQISSFTAFTSEPTTLTVKLIPKSSSPTVGYPSIYGFGIRAT